MSILNSDDRPDTDSTGPGQPQPPGLDSRLRLVPGAPGPALSRSGTGNGGGRCGPGRTPT